MNSDVRVGSSPILGTNINNLKFDKIMPEKGYIFIFYGKEDIKKDCKYCQKTDKKVIFYYAYGFECILKIDKRKCNRCKSCYFGH